MYFVEQASLLTQIMYCEEQARAISDYIIVNAKEGAVWKPTTEVTVTVLPYAR